MQYVHCVHVCAALLCESVCLLTVTVSTCMDAACSTTLDYTYGQSCDTSIPIDASTCTYMHEHASLCMSMSSSSQTQGTSVPCSPVHDSVSYTHLRAHETDSYLVCRLLLEKK